MFAERSVTISGVEFGYIMGRTGELQLYVAMLDAGWTDWPMLHPDGRMVWDAPERIPNWAKDIAYDLLEGIRTLDDLAKEVCA